ncbi:MAG: redoxin domain-containing protein [Phycisphaerae bacterium]|nr:redoxin domain-containing protein [Phycisphaerae bacterium]
MRKTALTICVAGLAAAILFAGGCRRPSQGPSPAVQPDAGQIRTAFLKEHKLLGKPVLIEFGLVTCELSDKGFLTMIQLHGSDLVAGLAYARIEASDDTEAVDKYYKAAPAGFPVVRDSDRKLADAFGATIYPVFLLIDKFGNIRYMGGFPTESLGDWSEMLLAEKTDPGPDAPRLGKKTINGRELLTSTKFPELGGDIKPLGDYLGPGGGMLVFVDTNCPYSAQAVKDLPGVARTLRKAMLSTVVVNITDAEEKVKAYYARQKLKLPVVYDVGSAVRINWDIQSVPTIIFFDAQRRVAYNGPAVWADVGRAGEIALGLPPGSLNFQARGTRFG